MKTITTILCLALVASGCTIQTHAMRQREHCLSLIETVEGVPDYVELSREVLDVYDRCKEDVSE